MFKKSYTNPLEAIKQIGSLSQGPIHSSFNQLEEEIIRYKWGGEPYNQEKDSNIAANYIELKFQELIRGFAFPLASIMGWEGYHDSFKKVLYEQNNNYFAELRVKGNGRDETIIILSELPENIYSQLKKNKRQGVLWEEYNPELDFIDKYKSI